MIAVTAGELLQIGEARRVMAVVGCGGKTTLINNLAKEYRHNKKVLITTTTKVFPPLGKEVSLCTTVEQCLDHKPHIGVQCFGVLNSATGKLEALPAHVLRELTKRYDLVLIEADGSRGLPCKGWRKDEPVVPPYCTDTIGVVTLEAVGSLVGEETVLRVEEFYQLTGVSTGERIDLSAITATVIHADGMFRGSVGCRSVWVNKAESRTETETAKRWLAGIKSSHPGFVGLTAYGSAKNNHWKEG